MSLLSEILRRNSQSVFMCEVMPVYSTMGLGPVGLIHQYVKIENMQGNDTINLIIRSPSILRIKLLLSAFNCKFQICKEHKEKKISYSHTGYDQIMLKLWKWVYQINFGSLSKF